MNRKKGKEGKQITLIWLRVTGINAGSWDLAPMICLLLPYVNACEFFQVIPHRWSYLLIATSRALTMSAGRRVSLGRRAARPKELAITSPERPNDS